jgi:regulator of sirC expression with transglutaminase-like and TPR domain
VGPSVDLQNPPLPTFVELAARLATGADPDVQAGAAALWLAAEFQPQLDVSAALSRLDALGQRAEEALQGVPQGVTRVAALVDHLHGSEGFRGDEESYDHPRNSYLDHVLIRRTGIPITLAIVYMEVGRRVGIPVDGICFPQHFLVRSVDEPRQIIDPFFGRILDREECTLRWKRAMGDAAPFEPDAMPPASVREILLRMLSNLERSFVSTKEFVLAASCCDRILLLAPENAGARRDRGLLYEHLECFDAAAADLQRFLSLAPEDPSADSVRRRLERLQGRGVRVH